MACNISSFFRKNFVFKFLEKCYFKKQPRMCNYPVNTNNITNQTKSFSFLVYQWSVHKRTNNYLIDIFNENLNNFENNVIVIFTKSIHSVN
jgi:hypothetical protein